jgi:hypothetical protein
LAPVGSPQQNKLAVPRREYSIDSSMITFNDHYFSIDMEKGIEPF